MSEMIQLTREEREKFAAYLEQEAVTADGLAKQVELIMKPLAEKYRREAHAFIAVALWLRSWEES